MEEHEAVDWGDGEEEQEMLVDDRRNDTYHADPDVDADDTEDAISLDGYDDDAQEYSGSRYHQDTDERGNAQAVSTSRIAPQSSQTSRSLRRESSSGSQSQMMTGQQQAHSPPRSSDRLQKPSLPLHLTHALPPKPTIVPSVRMHPSHPSSIEATSMRVPSSQSGPKETPLPPDWEVRTPRNDPTGRNKVYYYNVRTEESTWTRPEISIPPADVVSSSRPQPEPTIAAASTRDRESYRGPEALGSSYRPGRNGASDVDEDLQIDSKAKELSFEDRHYRPAGTEDDASSKQPPKRRERERASRVTQRASSLSPSRKRSLSKSPSRRAREPERRSRRPSSPIPGSASLPVLQPSNREWRPSPDLSPPMRRPPLPHSTSRAQDMKASEDADRGRPRRSDGDSYVSAPRSATPPLPHSVTAPALSRRSRTRSPPHASRDNGYTRHAQDPTSSSKPAVPADPVSTKPQEAAPISRKARQSRFDKKAAVGTVPPLLAHIVAQLPDPYLPDELREPIETRPPQATEPRQERLQATDQERNRGRSRSPPAQGHRQQSQMNGHGRDSLPSKPAASYERSPSPKPSLPSQPQLQQQRSRKPLPPQKFEFLEDKRRGSTSPRRGHSTKTRTRSPSPPPLRARDREQLQPKAAPSSRTQPRHAIDPTPDPHVSAHRKERISTSPADAPPDSDSEHNQDNSQISDDLPRGPRAERRRGSLDDRRSTDYNRPDYHREAPGFGDRMAPSANSGSWGRQSPPHASARTRREGDKYGSGGPSPIPPPLQPRRDLVRADLDQDRGRGRPSYPRARESARQLAAPKLSGTNAIPLKRRDTAKDPPMLPPGRREPNAWPTAPSHPPAENGRNGVAGQNEVYRESNRHEGRARTPLSAYFDDDRMRQSVSSSSVMDLQSNAESGSAYSRRDEYRGAPKDDSRWSPVDVRVRAPREPSPPPFKDAQRYSENRERESDEYRQSPAAYFKEHQGASAPPDRYASVSGVRARDPPPHPREDRHRDELPHNREERRREEPSHARDARRRDEPSHAMDSHRRDEPPHIRDDHRRDDPPPRRQVEDRGLHPSERAREQPRSAPSSDQQGRYPSEPQQYDKPPPSPPSASRARSSPNDQEDNTRARAPDPVRYKQERDPSPPPVHNVPVHPDRVQHIQRPAVVDPEPELARTSKPVRIRRPPASTADVPAHPPSLSADLPPRPEVHPLPMRPDVGPPSLDRRGSAKQGASLLDRLSLDTHDVSMDDGRDDDVLGGSLRDRVLVPSKRNRPSSDVAMMLDDGDGMGDSGGRRSHKRARGSRRRSGAAAAARMAAPSR